MAICMCAVLCGYVAYIVCFAVYYDIFELYMCNVV